MKYNEDLLDTCITLLFIRHWRNAMIHIDNDLDWHKEHNSIVMLIQSAS